MFLKLSQPGAQKRLRRMEMLQNRSGQLAIGS